MPRTSCGTSRTRAARLCMPGRSITATKGVREAWREGLLAFGEIDFEVDGVIDAGDQVLAVIRERQVGRASGAPVEATHLAVWTFADGKVVRLQVFDDRQQALEAVGLSE